MRAYSVYKDGFTHHGKRHRDHQSSRSWAEIVSSVAYGMTKTLSSQSRKLQIDDSLIKLMIMNMPIVTATHSQVVKIVDAMVESSMSGLLTGTFPDRSN